MPGSEPAVAVIAVQQRYAVPRVAVRGMPLQFHADLVVAKAKRVERFAGWHEVIGLVRATVIGQKEKKLFGNHVVQLELADPEIQPAGLQQVIESNKGVFEVKCSGGIRRRQNRERNVLIQGSGRPHIEAGKVEPLLCSCSGVLTGGPDVIDCLVVYSLPMPLRRDAEGDWEIARLLVDRGVVLVHELISVVTEGLPKVVKFRPSGVASRTRQAILPGKCGNGPHVDGM